MQTWKPTAEHQAFIRQYAKALESGDVALFAGAGLSRAAGFVDWRSLLKDIAAELKLDVDREADLVALAQYHVNAKKNRSRINQVLIDELTRSAARTRNHELIARLPIPAVWTTNYDQLLERAFEDAGKTVDIKVSQEHLAQTRRGRDLTLYKMHGCVTMPHEAVLTKDDYEQYERRRPLFVESLKGDLVGRTFLFVGFSFTDPNIDYILSRVRTLLGPNQRQHFCIMRKTPRPARLVGVNKAQFEYEQRKTELRQADLLRFGIETVWIDEFQHLESLLHSLSAFVHRKTIFFSGSARTSAPLGTPRLENLARGLGGRIIREGFRLACGFGYGLGEQCVLGALEALHAEFKSKETDRLHIRPFPRASDPAAQAAQNTTHREELLSQSGIVIVVSGNRNDGAGGIVNSPGVFEEVEIARRLGKFIVPIGATGHAAHEVWKRAITNPSHYLPGLSVDTHLQVLGNATASNDQLLQATLAILSAAERAVVGQ